MIKCKFCYKEFTQLGCSTHETFCNLNPNKKIAWNRGIKHNDDIKSKISASCKVKKINAITEEQRRLKISKSCKGKTGGYRKGSGRGKSGWFNGIYCDSSWELAYVIYCKDHDIHLVRNTQKRNYTFNDTIKNYIPDFISNGCVIEIKGYDSDEWKAKIKHNPDVIVLYEKDMKPYIDYAISKYGKNFTDLYMDAAEVGSSNGLENRGNS